MEKFFKFFVGLICAVMTIAWLRVMITPMGIAENLALIAANMPAKSGIHAGTPSSLVQTAVMLVR